MVGNPRQPSSPGIYLPDSKKNDLLSPLLLSDDINATHLNNDNEKCTSFSSSIGQQQQQQQPPSHIRRRNQVVGVDTKTEKLSSILYNSNNNNDSNNGSSIDTQRTATTSSTRTPRILDRTGRFHQSRGRWSVASTHPHRSRRCWDDWFHSLAYTPTIYLMLIVFTLYLLTVFFFASIYLLVSKMGSKHTIVTDHGIHHESYCGMQISNYMEAMYFSLSTMTTLGYAISDYYFGECWTPFLLVIVQIFSGIIFDAVAVGLLFQRMSRGQKRGRTIIFSDKAVVRRVRGVPYFMFRVSELRKRHIIEARVRVYCVRHERYPVYRRFFRQSLSSSSAASPSLMSTPRQRGGQQQHHLPLNSTSSNDFYIETSHYVTHPVKLHPEKSMSTNILMSLPHLVVHEIDKTSPLVPSSSIWYDEEGQSHSWNTITGYEYDATSAVTTSTDHKKDNQSTDNNRLEGLVISAKGTSSPQQSCSTNGNEAHDTEPTTTLVPPPPYEAASLEPCNPNYANDEDERTQRFIQYAKEHDEITKFLTDRDSEMIVLVEGTDEMTGSSVQARHSYRMDDILFDHAFANCVTPHTCIEEEEESSEQSGEVDEEDVEEGRGGGRAQKNGWFQWRRNRHSYQPIDRNGSNSGYNAAMFLDNGKFHDVVPAPLDCEYCPFVNVS
mmetsp:Transcript_2757/g.3773  ORF Transcript_2757/g.3773 Transcript_2757/m.3773 type:complete len:665 (-) Transcript_2757:265-2259(-)